MSTKFYPIKTLKPELDYILFGGIDFLGASPVDKISRLNVNFTLTGVGLPAIATTPSGRSRRVGEELLGSLSPTHGSYAARRGGLPPSALAHTRREKPPHWKGDYEKVYQPEE